MSDFRDFDELLRQQSDALKADDDLSFLSGSAVKPAEPEATSPAGEPEPAVETDEQASEAEPQVEEVKPEVTEPVIESESRETEVAESVKPSNEDQRQVKIAGDHGLTLLGSDVSLDTKAGYNSVQISKSLMDQMRGFVEHVEPDLASKEQRPTNPDLVNGFLAGLLRLKVTDASVGARRVIEVVQQLSPAFTDLSGKVEDVAGEVEGLRQTMAKVSQRVRAVDERTRIDEMALGWLIAVGTGKVSIASITPQTVDVTDASAQSAAKRLRETGARQVDIERREEAR